MNPNSYDYEYWAEKTKGRIVRALAKEYMMRDLNQKLESQPNYLFERNVLTKLEDIDKRQKNTERLIRYWMRRTEEKNDLLLSRVEEIIKVAERKTVQRSVERFDKIQITGPLLNNKELPTPYRPKVWPNMSNPVKGSDGPTWDDVMEEMIAKRSQLKKVSK